MDIGIGIVGAGYMGKAHAVAMHSVGAVFNTRLRPVCEMICTTTQAGASIKAKELGFKRSTGDWQTLVRDDKVEAIIIATPEDTHLEITRLACSLGKPVFCEKPLAGNMEDARTMVKLVEEVGVVNMTGFNYIRTPASQLARQIVQSGEIGEVVFFRGEHTEDFYADPQLPATWRAHGRANGTMGDLAPHMINAALALVGGIECLTADIKTVHNHRPSAHDPGHKVTVTNDDYGQFLCRFENGASGNLIFSRVAHGRKMGYIYEITGTKGAIRFNQEDQNSVWLYDASISADRQGFKQILTAPEHPDYVNFCLGPGHGTGYQDQIIIEARDFLEAINRRKSMFPTYRDGLAVAEIVEAAFLSDAEQRWVSIRDM